MGLTRDRKGIAMTREAIVFAALLSMQSLLFHQFILA